MSSTKSSADLSRGDTYRRYKDATRAFCNELSKLVPFKLGSVSDLAKAADHVLANSSTRTTCTRRSPSLQHLKRSLLTPLDETIRLRKAVGATYSQGEQDDGHAYMIQVLQHCRSVLRIVRSNLQHNNTENEHRRAQADDVANGVGFGLLNMDDDDSSDDDGDDEGNLKDNTPLESPAEASKQYSIENDLIEGSWVFQANLFFLGAESLFSIVADAYATLQNELTLLQSSGKPFERVNHETVVQVLKATATVNLAIEHMRCLEKSFVIGREPFFSIYHVLAVLIFPDLIKQIEGILDPLYMEQFPFDAVNLTAHCVRLGFSGPGVYMHALESMVDQMLTRNKKVAAVDEQQLAKIKDVCWTICLSADIERSLDKSKFGVEPGRNTIFDLKLINPVDGTVVRTVTVIDREWLDKYTRLGGKFGLLYTFAQMEKCRCDPPSASAMKAARASGEGISLESTKLVVDTLLGPRLFWCLFSLDNAGLLQNLPGLKDGLCLSVLKDFVGVGERRSRGMNFAEAFGFHALAYGASLLSAGNHAKRIAVLSRLTLQKFETQFRSFENTSYVSHLESMTPGLRMKLQLLVLNPLRFDLDQRGLVQAFWNPLLAGSVLLSLVFHSNMENGFGRCDALMQIRVTLHLYNALRQRNMIQAIDLLDRLGRVCATNEDIWPTGKSASDGFLKSFLSAIGGSSKVANAFVEFLSIDPVADQQRLKKITAGTERRMGNRAKHLDSTQQNALLRVIHLVVLRANCGKGSSKAKVLGPYAVSTSYKYAAVMEFPREQTTDSATNEIDGIGAMCFQQSTLVRDAIDAEHEMLSINWLKVGHLADEFIQNILESLRLAPLIAEVQLVMEHRKYKMVQEHDTVYQRFIAGIFLADMVFRELEFEKDIESRVNSQAVATIMKDFFSSAATMKGAVFF